MEADGQGGRREVDVRFLTGSGQIGLKPPFSPSTAKTRRAERPVAAFFSAGWFLLPRPLESTEGQRPARPCPRQRGQPSPPIPLPVSAGCLRRARRRR